MVGYPDQFQRTTPPDIPLFAVFIAGCHLAVTILLIFSYMFFSTLFSCIVWKKRIFSDRLFWFFSGIGILLSINIGLANFELYETMPDQYLPEWISSDTGGCVVMMSSPTIAALIIFFIFCSFRKKFFPRYAMKNIILWSFFNSYIAHMALCFGTIFYIS